MDIEKKIWQGSIWAVAMRWSMRIVGMLSIIVLARLLKPEDFGILAMASLLIGAFANFTGVGVGALLIREAEVDRSDIDTAWTLLVIQRAFLAVLVALLAYPTSRYFNEPRLTDVVYVCAFALFISAFENIGMVLVRKELDFATDFRYNILTKFIGAVVTIGLAFWLRSYWALALGRPISEALAVAMSYAMHPYRPTFTMRRSRRFYRFSLFVIASNTARFISNKADVFLVGTSGTAAQMGLYNIAADTSALPTTVITTSVGRALLPGLSRLKHDGGSGDEVNATFLQVVGSVALLCLPIGLGLSVVAPDFVRVVLGERWIEATELMTYLAVYGMLNSMINVMLGHVLIVTGHEFRQAIAWWLRAGLLVACALVGMRFGMKGIAIGATVSSGIMFVVAVAILKQAIRCPLSEFARIFWRPTLASLVMVVVVHQASQAMAIAPAGRLLLAILIGAACYILVLLAAWLATGRPPGPEAATLSAVLRRPVTRQK